MTASAAGVTGEVVFTATSTASASGLGVSISDGRDYAQFDRVVTWTVTVGNAGPSRLDAVDVEVALPAEISAAAASWQCIAIAGASCGGSGSGDLADSVDLPAGSSVVYLLSAVTTRDGDDRIEMTVEATGPAGTVSATDNTELVFIRDGFEVDGDGASGSEWPLAASGRVDADSLLVIDLANQAAALTVRTLAEAVDGSFRVEAVRIGAEIWVRLAGNGTASVWSRVEEGARIALAIESGHLFLAGTADHLSLASPAATLDLRIGAGH